MHVNKKMHGWTSEDGAALMDSTRHGFIEPNGANGAQSVLKYPSQQS
jgi:hypothetical protein